MSLKRNILANYASQIYVMVIGIVMVPLYIKYMGAEAYGLVGFFAMLQAWFNLLDMGLAPTMARETARFRGGATDALSYRRLVRALQAIFLAVALAGGGALFMSAGFIASDWLKVQTLPLSEVQFAVQMMALGVALRWMCGLYRGAVSGSERFVWLGGYNSLIATLRFVGVLPVLMFIGNTPTVFFTYQLLVAVIDLAGLTAKTYRLLPAVPAGQRLGWSFAPIGSVLKFSLSITFVSSVWVLVTQTDKLVLSKLLPLAEYGYFTLAVLVASGVMTISGPISSALLPRMTRLNAEGDEVGLIRLYRNATQLVGIIVIPAALVLAFFAEPVLWAWTGDSDVARQAGPVLALYALGNGILAIAAFPYYLQFAKGDLALHMIGSALFAMLLIPALIWATWRYGVIGAGYAWLGANMGYFLFWIPKVHRRFFAKGLHTQWLLRDIGPIALVAVFGAALVNKYIVWPQGRLPNVLVVAMVSLGLLVIASSGSLWMREKIRSRIVC